MNPANRYTILPLPVLKEIKKRFQTAVAVRR
jgi:hypothetical protein